MIINVEKRHVFLIVGVLVFFGGLFFVNAFGTSDPATLGHSSAEIIVDDAFCNRITGHGCGVDIDTDTNVVTECLDNEFLDGDGSCLTAEEIVGVAGVGVNLAIYSGLGCHDCPCGTRNSLDRITVFCEIACDEAGEITVCNALSPVCSFDGSSKSWKMHCVESA